MKLSAWAKKQGISYVTAYRWFRAGKMPCPCEQAASGTILVHDESETLSAKIQPEKIVLYGRVSSHDQRDDLTRQMSRLRDFCAAKGLVVSQEVSEIGSGLNGKRKKLRDLLSDSTVSIIVVEHQDRLTRFGFEFIQSALNSVGRDILVVNETENQVDLVQDFIEVVTSLCGKIYGRRSARNRAKKAFEATKQ